MYLLTKRNCENTRRLDLRYDTLQLDCVNAGPNTGHTKIL